MPRGPLVRRDPSRGHPTGLEEIANALCAVGSLGLYDLQTRRAMAAARAKREQAIRRRDQERQ